MGPLAELSLFSGAGGGLLASRWLLGWRTVCYVERDPWCQAILDARIADGYLDDAPIWDDARTFDGRPWAGLVDVVSAGFPCQPFSVAGKRGAASDERNGWPDTIRVIREVRPAFALLENVPGLLARSHGYLGEVLGSLAESGYDAVWDCIPAAACGAPHIRDRLWIVAADSERDDLRELAERAERHRRSLRASVGEPTLARDDGTPGSIPDADSAGRRARNVGRGSRARRGDAALGGGAVLADADRIDGGLGPDAGSGEAREADAERAPLGERSASATAIAGPGAPARGRREGERVAEPRGEQRARGRESDRRGRLGRLLDAEGWRDWPPEPAVGRVAHGVADRVGQLRALGNGQCPRVAALAWLMLTDELIA